MGCRMGCCCTTKGEQQNGAVDVVGGARADEAPSYRHSRNGSVVTAPATVYSSDNTDYGRAASSGQRSGPTPRDSWRCCTTAASVVEPDNDVATAMSVCSPAAIRLDSVAVVGGPCSPAACLSVSTTPRNPTLAPPSPTPAGPTAVGLGCEEDQTSSGLSHMPDFPVPPHLSSSLNRTASKVSTASHSTPSSRPHSVASSMSSADETFDAVSGSGTASASGSGSIGSQRKGVHMIKREIFESLGDDVPSLSPPASEGASLSPSSGPILISLISSCAKAQQQDQQQHFFLTTAADAEAPQGDILDDYLNESK
eukprot:PhM_4_TR14561/c0_g1_i1/m.45639